MTATESTTPPLGIIVVNYASHDLLARHLRATEADLTRAGRRTVVVVVDNSTSASAAASAAALCDEHNWLLLAQDDNVGFGRGINAGVAAAVEAGCEHHLLLNPDAWIDAASVAALEAVVTADPMTLAAPVITTPAGAIWSDGGDLLLHDGRTQATRKRTARTGPVREWVSGACLLVDTRLWERVGGFADPYFLYWEDVDLSWRVQESGGRVSVVRAARAVHDEGGTHRDSAGAPLSSTFFYYNARNRLLFAALRLDPAARRRWILSSPAAACWMLLWGGRRTLLRASCVAAVLRGTRDGLQLMRRTVARRGDDAIRVLTSFPDPRPTTNPYIVMLLSALRSRPEVSVATFTWRRALFGDYDVVHAHWPETLLEGSTPVKALARRALFAALLIRWRLRGTAIVRTVHNLELPEGISWAQRALLRRFDAWTEHRIRINAATPVPADAAAAVSTIEHGHYRDWFAADTRTPHPGQVAFVGLIRRYKAVDVLIRAFADSAPHSHADRLVIAGKPSTPELERELRELAREDPRIELRFRFLPDAELADIVHDSALVVLPYAEMHNSGTVLLVLSLGRAVLVPDNALNRALAQEVGPGWVHRYRGALQAADIEAALAWSGPRSAQPNLDGRGWDQAGRAHAAAFAQALGDVTARRRTRWI